MTVRGTVSGIRGANVLRRDAEEGFFRGAHELVLASVLDFKQKDVDRFISEVVHRFASRLCRVMEATLLRFERCDRGFGGFNAHLATGHEQK